MDIIIILVYDLMKQCNKAIKELVDDEQNKVLEEFLRRQRSQRALSSEHSFTANENSCLQSEYEDSPPNRVRGRSMGQQGVVVNVEDERTRLDTLSKPHEESDNIIQGEMRAKKDAMAQPIHCEDSSQDELTGKGS